MGGRVGGVFHKEKGLEELRMVVHGLQSLPFLLFLGTPGPVGRLFRIVDRERRTIPVPDQGLVLSSSLAESLGVTSRHLRRLFARHLGASPLAAAVAAGVGSTPAAAAGYTLSREMGGDSRLMAAIITATTLLSFITMPIAIALTLH